jgi:hypothetical protein
MSESKLLSVKTNTSLAIVALTKHSNPNKFLLIIFYPTDKKSKKNKNLNQVKNRVSSSA